MNGAAECRHERRVNFAISRDSVPHEYCPQCGWHRFRGVEYTKAEWYKAFIEWDDHPKTGDVAGDVQGDVQREKQGELF